jgi:hypothetical protein
MVRLILILIITGVYTVSFFLPAADLKEDSSSSPSTRSGAVAFYISMFLVFSPNLLVNPIYWFGITFLWLVNPIFWCGIIFFALPQKSLLI